jgi:hypothetical protein
VDGITARRNAVQSSARARSRSPAHNDAGNKVHNDEGEKAHNDEGKKARNDEANQAHNSAANQALDDNNQDDNVGLETQALLDANRVILTGSPRVAPCLPEDNRLREPGATELPAKLSPAVANPIDADDKLALVGVACGCRFLLDEVMEEYEELNRNLDATRSYFQEIRALINERKSMRGKQG